MDVSSLLVRAVVGGVLGGGRKQTRNATRFLSGGRGGFWSNPSTLMTAAGLAWGVFETLEQSGALGRGLGASSGAPATHPGVPPLPLGAPASAAQSSSAPAGPPAPVAAPEVSVEALRVVRLAVSAANADGAMHDRERALVLERAQAAGMGEFVERELAQPRPLRDIVAGVTDAGEAATLYVLAFAMLRADESVQPTERVFLAQLASLLKLAPDTVAALERDTGARIDAAEP